MREIGHDAIEIYLVFLLYNVILILTCIITFYLSCFIIISLIIVIHFYLIFYITSFSLSPYLILYPTSFILLYLSYQSLFITDKDEEMADFARSVLQKTLSVKYPDFFAQHFSECLLVMNDCQGKYVYVYMWVLYTVRTIISSDYNCS